MGKATLIQKVFLVSFLVILLGQASNGQFKCNNNGDCERQLHCMDGNMPSCWLKTNVCYCKNPHVNRPFTCTTVADCVKQLKCLHGTPSCFAKTQRCYCKLLNSLPNNETRCNNDADCSVLLKCTDADRAPTCFVKPHGCYCKLRSRPPAGAPSVTARDQD
ncbi:uncharacterized protein LOC132067956 [Lycium ferocissimum]|uniref:uncharacterized protein LOC132067956 n=1 Tax=Lycium ferocissimum TaxID=112874 RepID=UPI0028160F5B|nr:uncharacterized protein LOC132067956 [Lycium ferocissimum]